ncbi:DUF1415 domain-containing protein [Thiofilum flexile]|uniref:DUF1415 domain-containing protein n=1 Tax=Thiofilum flexile TaxID=125627 RepID=UPI00036283B6|nr:DUF1415 domain-containing protein [Thiofilum flexile]
MSEQENEHAAVLQATRCWVEQWVVKENLCPFAGKPVRENRVLYQVSHAQRPKQLLSDLTQALEHLAHTPVQELETTLLIHPNVLQDFGVYNAFLDQVDDLLLELDLEGEIQVASFHPHYQFADTDYDDVENFTNRSPYPMLHLIREASIEQAIDYHPNIDAIPIRNIEHVRNLGIEHMRTLLAQCKRD